MISLNFGRYQALPYLSQSLDIRYNGLHIHPYIDGSFSCNRILMAMSQSFSPSKQGQLSGQSTCNL